MQNTFSKPIVREIALRLNSLILLLPVCILLFAASAYSAPSSDFRKIKVAVLDFQQNGQFETSDIGKIVAEWFTTTLVDSGRFEIIERRLLQQILDEQKIGASGLIDPRSASQLGRLLGVNTVVSGTVQSYDRTFELNTRLIDVETGSIIIAESVKASSTSSLNALVKQVADKMIRYFPLNGYVVQRTGEKGVIDLGRKAGIHPGMVFKVFVEGKPLKHPMTGEILSVERIEKGVIRIKEVKDKTSIGDIEKENCQNCIKVGHLVSAVLAEDDMPSEPSPAPSTEPAPAPVKVAPPPPKTSLPAGVFKILNGTRNDIKATAVANNGSFAATVDTSGNISLWDIKTWNLIETFKDSRGALNAVAFSPDSKLVVTGGNDKEAIVWSIVDKKPIYKQKVRDKITSIVFAGDSAVAIGTDSKRFFVWEYKSGGDPLRVSTGREILALAASPDGRQIATGSSDNEVSIWDSAKGEKIHSLKGHDGNIRTILYSPGGKWLFSGAEDKQVIIWDPLSGRQIRKLSGHNNDVLFLAVSSDGRRLASSDSKKSDGTMIVWDTTSGAELKRFTSPKRVSSFAMTPNGRYALGGVDKDMYVFSLD
ncbi:MAG: hypothetical protein HXX17_08675 [Geobacteraceae bacterium]|nr:hypothetical protein [Geobacteraceae bacterium]